MKVTFTSHAQYRLMERKIPFAIVREIVLSSRTIFVDGDLLRVKKKVGDKILEVVYKKTKSDIVIITAYYL